MRGISLSVARILYIRVNRLGSLALVARERSQDWTRKRGTLMGVPNLLFEVETPLEFRVRVEKERWALIADRKHPIMRGQEEKVAKALFEPQEIRQSKSDPAVRLFYRADGVKRWICAVVKQVGMDGFLITAYRTDAIKEGEKIWPK